MTDFINPFKMPDDTSGSRAPDGVPGALEAPRNAHCELDDAWNMDTGVEGGLTPASPAYPFIILTNSSMRVMRSCMRKWHLKYVQKLGKPRLAEESEALFFGDAIHQLLEEWMKWSYGDNHLTFDVREFISQRWDGDVAVKARAMMDGYMRRWSDVDWELVATEFEFAGDIVNPDTNGKSRTFKFAGKVDGIVKDSKDRMWLVEHKTASYIDGVYISKLWTDSQIALYTYYLREQGYPIQGVIYDVLLKCKYKQKAGESDEDFQIRYAEACAKNKSGKSNITQREAETDEDYFARLLQFHAQPEAYHREVILIDDARIELAKNELWDATQRYLDAKSREYYSVNTDSCFQYNRQCTYYDYCSSGNENVLDVHFERIEPHEELDLISLFGNGTTGVQHASTD